MGWTREKGLCWPKIKAKPPARLPHFSAKRFRRLRREIIEADEANKGTDKYEGLIKKPDVVDDKVRGLLA